MAGDETRVVVAGDPLQEKLLLAEDRVAYVRAAVIAFNVFIYLSFLDPAVGIPALAWAVIVVASVYAALSMMMRPHRVLPLFMTGWFTTVTDSVLIVAWIMGTGGFHSPFYLLWYVSLAAIAFRFGMRQTFIATVLYISAYVGLVAALGQLAATATEVAVRSVYIGFVGVLVGLLAHESTRQFLDKAELGRVVAGTSRSSLDVSREVDMDRTLRTVLDSTREFVRADRAAVYLVDEDSASLRCAYAQGLSDQWIQARTVAYEKLPGKKVMEGEVDHLHVADAATDPRLEPIQVTVRQEGIRTYAVFPLQVNGQRIGVLSLYRDRVEPFSEHEISLAQSLADRAAGTIANARLVKELSESEARLQKVLSNAPVILFAMDVEGRLTMVEGEGTKALNMDPKQMIGRRVDEIYGDHSVMQTFVKRALAGKEFVDELKVDSTVFTVHYAPVRDENGNVDGVIGIAVDITERKRAQQEESQKAELEQLREIDQVKTLFINTAAHELRTPLTPIKVQLHLLRSGGLEALSERQRHAVDVLERNIDRLGHLVEDILEGARLQAGRLKVDRRPVSLDVVVREAVESFSEPARAAGVVLEERLDSGLVVPADPKRVIQVLFNLLSNALKFTPKGGRIVVETGRVGDSAFVRVTDTGAGLTTEQAARLFKPFSQVHDPMKTVRGGTGLGLYISRSLVGLHRGRIWCESPGPGKGSTFTFTLPLKAEEGEIEKEPDWGQVGVASVDEGHEEEILSPAERDRLAKRARELV